MCVWRKVESLPTEASMAFMRPFFNRWGRGEIIYSGSLLIRISAGSWFSSIFSVDGGLHWGEAGWGGHVLAIWSEGWEGHTHPLLGLFTLNVWG